MRTMHSCCMSQISYGALLEILKPLKLKFCNVAPRVIIFFLTRVFFLFKFVSGKLFDVMIRTRFNAGGFDARRKSMFRYNLPPKALTCMCTKTVKKWPRWLHMGSGQDVLSVGWDERWNLIFFVNNVPQRSKVHSFCRTPSWFHLICKE